MPEGHDGRICGATQLEAEERDRMSLRKSFSIFLVVGWSVESFCKLNHQKINNLPPLLKLGPFGTEGQCCFFHRVNSPNEGEGPSK